MNSTKNNRLSQGPDAGINARRDDAGSLLEVRELPAGKVATHPGQIGIRHGSNDNHGNIREGR